MSAERATYEKAIDLFGQGKLDEASAALEDLIRTSPGFGDAYDSLGMIRYRQGRIDEAIEWTNKLVELWPDYAMAHTNLSIFYVKKGMKEKAEEEKAKAIVVNFSNPKAKKCP